MDYLLQATLWPSRTLNVECQTFRSSAFAAGRESDHHVLQSDGYPSLSKALHSANGFNSSEMVVCPMFPIKKTIAYNYII